MTIFDNIVEDIEFKYLYRLKKGERILISVTEQCGCEDKACKICRGSGWITEAKTIRSDYE